MYALDIFVRSGELPSAFLHCGHTSHTYLPGIELSTQLISETSKRPNEKMPGNSGAVGLVMFGGEHGGKPLVTDSGSFSQTSSE